MLPEWLRSDFGTSPDKDLRDLQLRWFRDDLWMRRIAFLICAVVALGSLVMLWILAPGAVLRGIATSGLLAGPVAYYFGRKKRV